MTEFNSFYRGLQMFAIAAACLAVCAVIICVAGAIGTASY